MATNQIDRRNKWWLVSFSELACECANSLICITRTLMVADVYMHCSLLHVFFCLGLALLQLTDETMHW